MNAATAEEASMPPSGRTLRSTGLHRGDRKRKVIVVHVDLAENTAIDP